MVWSRGFNFGSECGILVQNLCNTHASRPSFFSRGLSSTTVSASMSLENKPGGVGFLRVPRAEKIDLGLAHGVGIESPGRLEIGVLLLLLARGAGIRWTSWSA